MSTLSLDQMAQYDMFNAKSAGCLALNGLNHISRLSSDLQASKTFFVEVLGFKLIKRPSFDFEGYWLYAFGIGVHLIHSDRGGSSCPLNPRSDHLSFTCESLALVEQRLQDRGIPFVKETVVEHGIKVSQVFFSDPGGSGMVEVCNCDCLPIIMLHESSEDWQQEVTQCPWGTGGRNQTCESEKRGSSVNSGCSSGGSFDLQGEEEEEEDHLDRT